MEDPLHDPTLLKQIAGGGQAESYLCWSRMQAESGQELLSIIARKELERRAGNGLFFWGVGNPPARATPLLARLGVEVPVVFSLMKGKPKAQDARPSAVLVWRRFVDLHGVERDLPPNVLITSRDWTGSREKKRHFALVCHSHEALHFIRGTPFCHTAYRNVGGAGSPVGASQVTALVRRVGEPDSQPEYEANLQAKLTGSYWVRLSDPIRLPASEVATIELPSTFDIDSWLSLVAALRSNAPEIARRGRQGELF